MPVFVFIMAIGLAFATEKANDSQSGFYYDPGSEEVIPVTVDCDSSSDIQCTYNGHPVFAEEELKTPINETKPR